ncbi:MAG TPA: acyltransferase family protein [Acidimicrobiales bacterium]|nr:acyltransferase family protein [Acidimicrobiales bacterium]
MNLERSAPTSGPEPVDATAGRDRWLDLLRAGSLSVVVLWHWVFTIIRWAPDGPHATNPIGTTRGLWLATWFLQVMPVFFAVGGAVHARSLVKEPRWAEFVGRRLAALLPGALVLAGLALALHRAFAIVGEPPQWLARALILVLSPLWFLAVYSLLIVLAPLAWQLHKRFDYLVPIVLGGLAMTVDVARFSWDMAWVEWLNWVFVWALIHQVGFHWDKLTAAPRRFAWTLTWIGGFALLGLTNMNFYPRSAVGVPGERFSNLGPPTIVIVALACFQFGVVTLIRERALALTEGGWLGRASRWITTNAQSLYLGHAFAYAAVYVAVTELFGRPGTDTTWRWWLTRPFWFVAPALVFAAGFRLTRMYRRRPARARVAAPALDA